MKGLINALRVIAAPRKTPPLHDSNINKTAVAWLKEIQKRIPAAIKEFEENDFSEEHARELCYDMANIILERWFRITFKVGR